MGERKFAQMVLVTWPRWPPCPYMVKTLKKYSSLEPKGCWYASLGAWVLPSFAQMMTLGWPWPVLWQIWSHMLLYGKKGKTLDFSETIGVYDLKLAIEDWSDKKFLLTSKLCPLGAVWPLPWGYVHVLNHEKNCTKPDFKKISLKLAPNR